MDCLADNSFVPEIEGVSDDDVPDNIQADVLKVIRLQNSASVAINYFVTVLNNY